MIRMHCWWSKEVLKPGFCSHVQVTYYPNLPGLVFSAVSRKRVRILTQGSASFRLESVFSVYYPSSTKEWGLGVWGPMVPVWGHPQRSGWSNASPAPLSLRAKLEKRSRWQPFSTQATHNTNQIQTQLSSNSQQMWTLQWWPEETEQERKLPDLKG